MGVQSINDSFFGGAYQDVWRSLTPTGLTLAESDFIFEVCQLQQHSKILDLMCGYGRHSLELAKRGCNITAIDSHQAYIDEITASVKQDRLSISPVCGNVLETNFDEGYSAAICMGNSISFFDRNSLNNLLKKTVNALDVKGYIVISSWMIMEIAIRHFKEKEWYYAGDYRCLIEHMYKTNPARIESDQLLIKNDGRIEKTQGVDYLYSIDDFENLFQSLDLKLLGVYSTPRKRQFRLGDIAAYIVAQRI